MIHSHLSHIINFFTQETNTLNRKILNKIFCFLAPTLLIYTSLIKHKMITHRKLRKLSRPDRHYFLPYSINLFEHSPAE